LNDTSLSSLDGHNYSLTAGVLGSNVLGNKDIVANAETIHSAALRVYGAYLRRWSYLESNLGVHNGGVYPRRSYMEVGQCKERLRVSRSASESGSIRR